MDLFEREDEADDGRAARPEPTAPLAARMRPLTLDEIVGQDHILGPGRLLRRAVEADRLSSLILFGPPGTGKTTTAEVIARATRRHFARASGVTSNVADLRELIEQADLRRARLGRETLLFVDEIHRFSKSQQDVLLPHVENGTVTLIGATTHNPMFFVNAPLLSRSLVFELKALDEAAVVTLLRRALTAPQGLAPLRVAADDEALRHLAGMCEGDARRALNALETAALSTPPDPEGSIRITRAVAEDSIQKKAVLYDRDGDGHYDTISAFIKSVRGSDPDAALYWLAKMIHAGEDPRFIARRLVILASEDIGNADPRGLSVAVAASQAVEFIGMPEGRIVLAQATTYLATAPKSNAAYLAVDKALEDVRNGRVQAVPRHLRNKKVVSAERAGESEAAYRYPHDYAGHVVAQDYLEVAARYYEPTHEGYEDTIARRLAAWRAARAAARAADGGA